MRPRSLTRSLMTSLIAFTLTVNAVSPSMARDTEEPTDGGGNGDGPDPNTSGGSPQYTGAHLAKANMHKCMIFPYHHFGHMQWNALFYGFPEYKPTESAAPQKADSYNFYLGVHTGNHVGAERYKKSSSNMGPIVSSALASSLPFDPIPKGGEARSDGLIWFPGGNNHLQGMTRFGEATFGANFIVFSGGDWHDRSYPDNLNGAHLFFAHLGSRSSNPEHFFTDERNAQFGAGRSNLVQASNGIGVPDSRDHVYKTLRLDWFDRNRGTNPPRRTYWHAGGMQEYQGILAVPLESSDTFFGNPQKYGKVVFIDVTKPWEPTPIEGLEIQVTTALGAVALTRDVNNRWLAALWRDKELSLYRSRTADIRSGFENLQMIAGDGGVGRGRLPAPGSIDDDPGAYQTLNFLNDCNGDLFLVGLNKTLGGFGNDWLDIYRIELRSSPFEQMGYNFTKVFKKRFELDSNVSSFSMASGIYVSPGGRITIYSNNGYRKTPTGHSVFDFREYVPKLTGADQSPIRSLY